MVTKNGFRLPIKIFDHWIMIENFQSLANEFGKGACNIFWKVLVELHAWKPKGTKNSVASYKKTTLIGN
jgi:hypothetical protein